jgi:hypothetical protein
MPMHIYAYTYIISNKADGLIAGNRVRLIRKSRACLPHCVARSFLEGKPS